MSHVQFGLNARLETLEWDDRSTLRREEKNGSIRGGENTSLLTVGRSDIDPTT